MYYHRQTTYLITLFFLLAFTCAQALDCPVCKGTGISGLAMACPDCGANLHDPTVGYLGKQQSSLKIRLLYTGDKPDKMPIYGKLFINGKYYGNIDLIEKQEKGGEALQTWESGLGKYFTGYYERILTDIPSGVVKIEVEMKFARLFGLGRSYKRVVFPYVSFKAGERTTVEHYFCSAATFHQFNPKKPKPIPIISESKLQAASGTVAINIPLFQ